MIQGQKQQCNIDKVNESSISDSVNDTSKEIKSSISQRKLTNQERQNAIFSQSKPMDKHVNATQQVIQINVCQSNANDLIKELNQEKDIIKESIQILNEQITQENTETFTEIREKMNQLRQEFQRENQIAYQDQSATEQQVLDLRKQKIDLFDKLGYVKSIFEKNFEDLGYTIDEIQSHSNSILIQDIVTPKLSKFIDRSIIQSQNINQQINQY